MDDTQSAPAFVKVLASGSSGNCTVLLPQAGPDRRFWLIDAGLSPRRTRRALADASLTLDSLAGVLLTHLDSDHWYPGWKDGLPAASRVLLHARHGPSARRGGLIPRRSEAFDKPFPLAPGAGVHPILGPHDEHGSTAFRFEFDGLAGRGTLGFATDVGRFAERLVEHFRGVDVLAIESNYCPRLQRASGRPAFLQSRIMGGHGHLSNEECARAVALIGPCSHVVLLHLSRECNRADLARLHHAAASYTLTVSAQFEATGWIPVRSGSRRVQPIPVIHAPLFDWAMGPGMAS